MADGYTGGAQNTAGTKADISRIYSDGNKTIENSEDIIQCLHEMQNVEDQLMTYWIGPASQAFNKDFDAKMVELLHFCSRFGQFGVNQIEAAKIEEKTEQGARERAVQANRYMI